MPHLRLSAAPALCGLYPAFFALLLVLAAAFACAFFLGRRRHSPPVPSAAADPPPGDAHPSRFSREEIERAFQDGQFRLYLHFYVDAASSRIAGGEALSRWLHPVYGLLSPAAFLPSLQREGLLERLDFLILEKACGFLQSLRHPSENPFFISCNFSPDTVLSDGFAQRCEALVAGYRFDRSRLVLEFGREALLHCNSPSGRSLWDLHDSGIRIALGSLRESFPALLEVRRFPFDVLVLDPGLMGALGTDPGNVALRAIVRAGHDLGSLLFAVGVERREQFLALQVIGCDLLQGFYFCHPVPAEDAVQLLSSPEAAV